MAEEVKREAKGTMNQLEVLLDEYLVKKAPFTLPDNAKEFIVKISPYVIIIMAVMVIPLIIMALGLIASGLGAAGAAAVMGFLSGVVSLVALVMEVRAVPGLFRRTQGGWRLAFYSSVVSLVGNIISFNIIGGIIGAIIGWYFLFQIRDKYRA